MNEEIAQQVFWELHSDLSREGPGDDASTARAFSLLTDLPPQPRILDVGCGPGMQTLQLARLAASGHVTAVDLHQPFLEQLKQSLQETGLGDRVTPLQADMAAMPFATASFDVIWSEGAAYSMGFGKALTQWRSLLTPQGYLVASEITWLRSDPPEPLKQFWQTEYPLMQSLEANLTLFRKMGYIPVAHLLLPAKSWWTFYYTPLAKRIQDLLPKYTHSPDALQLLESHQQEIELFRRYSADYGYVFYIGQVAPRTQ
ncbi:MAG: class I SAM-dependent methyltransferase [Leptolyngbya sp. SIOISBB]|nr:class I SAM-dependent methyltransferase [Leptolyngbya sp. SIOISBB]